MSESLEESITDLIFETEPRLNDVDPETIARVVFAVARVLGCAMTMVGKDESGFEETLERVTRILRREYCQVMARAREMRDAVRH